MTPPHKEREKGARLSRVKNIPAESMSASFVPSSPAESNKDLNPNLAHAQSMYLCQLAETVAPFMLETIKTMYKDAKAESSSGVVQRFQGKLREIPRWSEATVQQHTAPIEMKVPYLDELVTAAFVSYVKVMSSIKLNPGTPNIRLKLPTNQAFIHQAHINIARDFYNNPALIFDIKSYENNKPMYLAFDRTIRHMLPIKDILKAYLGTVVDEAHTVSPTLDEEEEEHEDDDEPSPAMFEAPSHAPVLAPPAPSPVLAPPAPSPALAPPSGEPIAQVTECETRTISIPPAKDSELFSDADDDEADWK